MAIYKLGDISIFKNGSTPSTKNKKLWKKEIPFFGPANIETQLPTRWISSNSKLIKRAGTVVVSTTATIGNIGILSKNSWFNQQITSIEARNNIIFDKYLYYFFINNQDKIKKMSGSGSIFTILKISTFKNWKINLPILTTQQQIIDIIEPIEKLVYNINAIFKNINLKIKNLPNNGQIKLSEIGHIVKYKAKNIKQISAKIMQKRNYILNDFEKEGTYKTNNFFVAPKTLLINTIRTYLEKFSIVCDNADANGTLASMQIYPKYEATILKNLLNNDFWQNAKILSYGTKMPVLNKIELMKIKIIKTNNIYNLFDLIVITNKILLILKNHKNQYIKILIK